jgi:hypothetical protein
MAGVTMGDTFLFWRWTSRTSRNFAALARDLVARLAGHVTTVADVEEFVLADTPFHAGHYKRVLAEFEGDGGVAVVDPKPGRRRGTFADAGMKLRFFSGCFDIAMTTEKECTSQTSPPKSAEVFLPTFSSNPFLLDEKRVSWTSSTLTRGKRC